VLLDIVQKGLEYNSTQEGRNLALSSVSIGLLSAFSVHCYVLWPQMLNVPQYRVVLVKQLQLCRINTERRVLSSGN
jgi:hypothetical protein